MMRRADGVRTASYASACRAGDQQVVAGGHDPLGNGGDLLGGLARAEHDFRESLADGAVVIDSGEARGLRTATGANIVGVVRAPPQV